MTARELISFLSKMPPETELTRDIIHDILISRDRPRKHGEIIDPFSLEKEQILRNLGLPPWDEIERRSQT
jgi:hypothetical protein